jgi:hypothetical protein
MKKMVGICKTVEEEDGPNDLNLMARMRSLMRKINQLMMKLAGMRSAGAEDDRNEIS